MYIFHRFKDIYETSSIDSIEHLVSWYVLSHIHEVNELSVGKISEATSISKSAISKFFKNLIFDGGFSQLKNAMYFELQYLRIDDQTLKKNALDFLNQYHIEDYFFVNDVKRLAKVLYTAESIILFGDESKKSYFDLVINFFLFHGKKILFSSWKSARHQKIGLESLKEKDVFILIDTDNSLFDFFMKLNMSIEMYPYLENIAAQKFYIGLPSQNSHSFETIGIFQKMNIFSHHIAIEVFCVSLLLESINLYNK